MASMLSLSSALSYVPSTLGVRAPASTSRAASAVVMADSALIIQNKGGGHGEIGYHLALELAKERGMSVSILHEGPNKSAKPPHNAYGDLDAAGVKVSIDSYSNYFVIL